MTELDNRYDDPNRHPDPSVWWKNRRRHSYISMVGLFLLIGIMFVLETATITAALPLFQTIAWIFGGVIITYVIAATAEDLSKIKR